MNEPIEIACTADGTYAPHTGTMLASLLAATPAPCRVHVLYQHLGADDRARLRTVAERAGTPIDFLRIPTEAMHAFPTARFHASCWFRVLIPKLLPGLPRMLYLDSDMVVRASLSPLWQTDLAGRPFAAVVNPLYPFLPDHPRQDLGLHDRRQYLNSGVLLMDLARMREQGFVERIRAYAAAHPDNPYPEQDALSALFHDAFLQLHPRWNAQSTLWDLRPAQLPFSPQEVAEARENPAIIHFIGPYKPWQYLCRHPRRALYFEFRAGTPWPPGALEGASLTNRLLRPLPVVLHYRWHRIVRGVRLAVRRVKETLGRRAQSLTDA